MTGERGSQNCEPAAFCLLTLDHLSCRVLLSKLGFCILALFSLDLQALDDAHHLCNVCVRTFVRTYVCACALLTRKRTRLPSMYLSLTQSHLIIRAIPPLS